MFFSKSQGGFYSTEIHGGNMPADALEISAELYSELMAGQAVGKVIFADHNGLPALSDPPEPTAEQIAAAVQALRSIAYRDESDPLFFKAQRGEATMDEWLAKVEEIKARIPDGVMPS